MGTKLTIDRRGAPGTDRVTDGPDTPVAVQAHPVGGMPAARGLYDPANEHDACGVGFIAHVKGEASHAIVADGLAILENMTHRGAVGADPLVGDGAGMLMQIPDRLLRDEMGRAGVTLPPVGEYGVGQFFMPREEAQFERHRGIIERALQGEGLSVIGTRDVPVDNASLSKADNIRASEPRHLQVFVGRPDGIDDDAFERHLFLARKVVSNTVFAEEGTQDRGFYPVSMSARTIVYKGKFLAYQLGAYYADLTDERTESAVALVHQRFSTNTFPSWKLAHPYRMVAHNGEINTLRGNVNWMSARQASVSSPLFGDDIAKLWPISYEGQSDTACFDNALEFLVRGGYSLPHAMMTLIPRRGRTTAPWTPSATPSTSTTPR